LRHEGDASLLEDCAIANSGRRHPSSTDIAERQVRYCRQHLFYSLAFPNLESGQAA
jgi:hypothetical protein